MRKPKVLVVDDEQRNQRVIVETLEDTCELTLTSSGEEALAQVEIFDPDLILLDIMMPGIDGYEVCKRVKSMPTLSFAKVILVSGKAMIEERLKGYEVGADDYMTKPFVPDELLAKAKVFLKLALLERELHESNIRLDEKVREKTQQLLNAEAKLINSAKMSALGEMAGGVAHEINTPLASISMLAEEVLSEIGNPLIDMESTERSIRKIIGAVKRISTIILGLRTFSRDGSKDRFEIVSVKRVIDETISLCSEKLKYSGVRVDFDLPADDVQIHGQSVQLSQVLVNLLNNACDAIEKETDKWIKISVQSFGANVEIAVIDCGKGISQATQEKMFQPFFTTKEIGKGTGIGLSISKGIVESHNGDLTVDSKCPNTKLVIRLPQTNSEARIA